MRKWVKNILYSLCILEICSANPTRPPDIIKDNEKITMFQNKLPEDTLDSEPGVVGRPLNVTKNRVDQQENNQSPSRENKKHHCPFCQYASNIEASIRNQQELDSDSAQPYLIIGNIKPGNGNTSIITEENTPDHNNSTWNPQNEIKAILKIPDGSSANKEYKRCTHSENTLGGSLHKTELDNNILNNPELLNNIDFSCCSTLRRILLHALKLEGKCLCSENRATSPIINITALRDNEFENGIIQQEFPPIFIRQNTQPKLINQEAGVGNNNLLRKGYIQAIKDYGENHEANTPGMQVVEMDSNIASVSIGMPNLTTNSDGSKVSLSNLNTSLVTDEKNYNSSINNENIDGKQSIRVENELSTMQEHADSITEPMKQTKPSSEAKVEHLDTTNKFSRVEVFGADVTSTGENIINSSIVLNENLKQISKEHPGVPVTKINYTNNGTLELNVDQGFDNSSLREELNEENIYEVASNYTTESELEVIETGDLISTYSPDNLLEINMQFSDGSTQSIKEPMQVTETLNSILTDNNTELIMNGANQIGDPMGLPTNYKDLLQSKSENLTLGNELHPLEKKKTIFAENKSSTVMIEERNNFPTTTYTEDWGGVNFMTTAMAYESGQTLEIDNMLLKEVEAQNNTVNPITSTTSPSIIVTVASKISEKPNVKIENTLKDQDKDSHNVFNNPFNNSFNKRIGTAKVQYVDSKLQGQSILQQNDSEDTLLGDKNVNLRKENSAGIPSINTPETSIHTLSVPKQDLFSDELTVQQTQTTQYYIGDRITEGATNITSRDFSFTFEENSHTTETYLQEAGSSTSGFDSLATESILQETKSTELPMWNGMSNLSTENTLNVNYSDISTNSKQLSPEEFLLGTGQPQSTEENLTTGNPSEIHLSDSQQLIPQEIETIGQHSQMGENVRLDGLETGNFMIGSIKTVPPPTQPTDYPLEEMLNFTTESPTVNESNHPLGNIQPGENKKVNHHAQIGEDILLDRLESNNYVFTTQTPSTESPLEEKTLNLATGSPSDIGNRQPGDGGNVEHQLKNRENMKSGTLESGNEILGSIQTSEIELSTLPTESESTMDLKFVDMNIGTVTTTPLDSSLLLQFNEDNTESSTETNQNQDHTYPITGTNSSELLLSSEKINVTEDKNSTGIDQEMDKAENILKMLIDGFKKTHLRGASNDEKVANNPKIDLMEASTFPLLGHINKLEFSKNAENENLTNIGTKTDKPEIIEQYPSNFEFDSSGNNVYAILQNAKIDKSTDGDFIESTTMSSDNITETSTTNVNTTEIQYSSESNNISKSVNMVDYDKYLDEINELHKFSIDNRSTEIDRDSSEKILSFKMSSDNTSKNLTSNANTTEIQSPSEMNNTSKINVNLVDYDQYLNEINELKKLSRDNQTPKIENLRDSNPGSTLPPQLNFQTLYTKDTTEESSLSIINLFTSRPINDVELKLMSYNTESTSIGPETGLHKGLGQNPQKIMNPNFVSLLPNEFETDTKNTMNQEGELDNLSDYSEQTTKISVWNNVTPEIGVISSNLGQTSPGKVETQVNILNSTDLEEEILSTGNYIVHHVNVSINGDFENLNNNTQETPKFNLSSENMKLNEFETTTTMIMKYKENNVSDFGSSYLSTNLSEDSNLIESTNIKSIKYSDDKSTNLTQTPKPTEISELEIHSIDSDNNNTNLANISEPIGTPQLEIHSPLIVCFPQEDSLQFNNDLLGSRFFVQNDANIIEFELVRKDKSLCGCPPHSSYELKPKTRVSKADMNLLKSLEGQHISKILRRAHKILDKTTDNYKTTTENDHLRKNYLDSHGKKMRMSDDTSENLDVNNENSENQAVQNTHVEDRKKSENLEETPLFKPSCNCQCLGNVNPTKLISEKRKEPQNSGEMGIHRGQDEILKLQIGKSEKENIMRTDKNRSDHKEETNYKRKNNTGRLLSRRLDFPIKVDKDILRRFQSVYRPYNYFR